MENCMIEEPEPIVEARVCLWCDCWPCVCDDDACAVCGCEPCRCDEPEDHSGEGEEIGCPF